jgi:hypothetical protein
LKALKGGQGPNLSMILSCLVSFAKLGGVLCCN